MTPQEIKNIKDIKDKQIKSGEVIKK